MSAIKITNYIGEANTFTWPHNPRSIDIASNGLAKIKNYGLTGFNVVTGGAGIAPRQVIIVGYFDGTNKLTNWQNCSVHFHEDTKLKKFYWESDYSKFYLGVATNIKQTNVGGRTNFIDYVATFQDIIGVLWSDTQDTSGTNDGNAPTYIEEITGTYDGTGDVTFSDNHGTTLTIPSGSFSGTEQVILRYIHFVDAGDGIPVTEYNYAGIEVDSGTTDSTTADKLIQSGQNFSSTVNVGDLVKNTTDGTYATVTAVDSNTQLSLSDDIMVSGETFVIYTQTNSISDSGFGRLRLFAGENVTNITTTNLTSVTTRYRDAWYA